jgi:hypothetical protein
MLAYSPVWHHQGHSQASNMVGAKCWESKSEGHDPQTQKRNTRRYGKNTRTKRAKVQGTEYEGSITHEFGNKCTLCPRGDPKGGLFIGQVGGW